MDRESGSTFKKRPAAGAARGPGRAGGAGKTVKVATPRYLENAALHYLERFSASSEALRRVLMRKVKRSAEAHGTDEREGARVVDELIERFKRSKLIDDQAFANAKADRLHRRGGSARAIKAKLGAYGLEGGEIAGAIASLDEGERGAEDEAAWAYARRRKLGPYRSDDDRKERRDKDLGAMARAGFGYGVATRVIDAPEPR